MALPEGVKIQGFQPGAVPLRFEPRAEALVDVEVKLEGKLPEGYEVYAANAEPARVRLSGPSDRLNALQKAPTETILLDGRKESFTLSQVSINIADPKIDILDPTVDVHVEIGEKRVYKSFADVPLRFVNSEEALLPYIAAISRPYRARVPR
jgi:YbbR domain-containing protein